MGSGGRGWATRAGFIEGPIVPRGSTAARAEATTAGAGAGGAGVEPLGVAVPERFQTIELPPGADLAAGAALVHVFLSRPRPDMRPAAANEPS